MSSHLKGLLITTLGVLLVVPDSLFVRVIDADPMVTAFWRSLTSGLIILAVVLAWLTRNVLLTIVISMGLFFFLHQG